MRGPSRLKLVLAFAAVYVLWGSTYLAIRYAIETMPPLLMAGVRFVTAGTFLYVVAKLKGSPRPDAASWKRAAVIGALLLLGGNGMVVLAEQKVSSGLTALLIATEPLIIVLLDWLRPGGARPAARVVFGLLLGMAGMVILVGPVGISGEVVDPLGALLIILAALAWAGGSIYSARGRSSVSPLMAAAMQMLVGGALLLVVGTAMGEASTFHFSGVAARSVIGLLYLVVFGSLIGYTCYGWLLRNTTPSLASTYAYVNPIVAVVLGWAVAGEVISWRTVYAAVAIIGAVVLITTSSRSVPPVRESEDSLPFPRPEYAETGD